MAVEFAMGLNMMQATKYNAAITSMTMKTMQFSLSVKESSAVVRDMNKSAQQTGGISKAFGAITGALEKMPLKKTFQEAAKWMINSSAQMEEYESTLAGVLGTQEKATVAMSYAKQFAKQTPFKLPEIVEATASLGAFGIAAEKNLGAIGGMAKGTGKPLKQVVDAVTEAQSGDFKGLSKLGITKDMIAEQGKAQGVNIFGEGGQVTDPSAFNTALFSLMEQRYQGALQMNDLTFNQMLEKVEQFKIDAGATLGKPFFDVAKLGLSALLVKLYELQASGVMEQFAAKIQQAVDAAMPAFVSVWQILETVGTWVWNAASLIIQNWGHIAPFIEGVAAAFALILGPVYLLLGLYRAWTIAQAILNAVMAVNPIYLIIVAIGLLIGAGLWLIKNWTMVKNFFLQLWTDIVAYVQGIGRQIAAWVANIIATVQQLWNGVVSFIQTLPQQAYTWGASIISAMINGILAMANDLYNSLTTVFNFAKKLLPNSDAEEGPFSQLTRSGGTIITTMAEGVDQKAGVLPTAVSNAFSQVNPAGSAAALGNNKNTSIGTLVDQIVIQGADTKNAKQLVDEIITELHNRLSAAANIAGTTEMGGLL